MSIQPNSDLPYHLAKLMRRTPLSDRAQQAFLGLQARKEKFAAYRDIVREGDAVDRCCFVETGLVSRYKSLRNGGRQIVSFHVPGDLVDLQSSLMKIADHGIRTHTPTTVLTVSPHDILRLVADFPELGRALWFETLIDAAIFREWTLNVGRRTGLERTAHLLLEFAYRFQEIGQSDGKEFELPITQVDLADALGLSPVHVNRSLQALRSQSLIRTFRRTFVIEDREALVRLADFHTTYLHPEGPRSPE
jgi:CRP-like cAMP-binding protein